MENIKTNDDLQNLREKVSTLNDDELRLRDLYLKKLANGTLQGPPTSSSYINRTHTKYFDDNEILSKIESVSAYQLLRNSIKDNELDYDAINFFDFKTSYREMYNKIDKIAKMLLKSNVKKGDVVSVCLPNIPEGIYVFFAINLIGATANMIDVRYKSKQLKQCIEEVNSNILFIFDNYNNADDPNPLDELDEVYEQMNLKKVVKIRPVESLPFLLRKTIGKSKKYKYNDKYLTFDEALKMGNYKGKIEPVYDETIPAVYEHTSGSTGTPKVVALSNKTFVSVINGYDNFGMNVQPKDVFLNLIPPFMAYGIIPSISYPLYKKMEVVLIPKFEEEKFYDQLIKFRPVVTNATKMHWGYVKNIVEGMENRISHLNEEILKSQNILNGNFTDVKDYKLEKINLNNLKKALAKEKEKYAKVDFSYLKVAGIGGDTVSAEFERQMNEFLRKHGCNYSLSKGYGMTEVGSTFIASSGLNNHGDGAVGIPFTNNNIMIYDFDNNQEKAVNTSGEVCLSGPSMTKGYVNNEEATNSTLVEIDGKKWIRTGDLGSVNEKGEVYVDGRIKRLIIINGGDKIPPKTIEDVIAKCSIVKDVCVVGVPDDVCGNIVKAHIILKNGANTDNDLAIDEINEWCKKMLSINLIPAEYEINKEFPKTPADKVDINAIVKMDIENKQKNLKRR